MPIYAYRCAACGHTKDVLQKLSDAPLVGCPACAASRFEKQVTAAGFQLKGSGWYVTDFREGASKKADKAADQSKSADAATSDAKTDVKPASDGAAGTAAAAPAPAAPAPSPPPSSSSS